MLLRIDRAMSADARELVALHDAVADEVTARLGRGHWSKHRRVPTLRERIATSDGHPASRTVYVLRRSNRIVGTVTLSARGMRLWRKRMWTVPDAPALAVFDLAVHPDWHRQGFGKRLMAFAEAQAADWGLRWVRLDAYTANPDSNAFYQALGYENRGTQEIAGIEIDLYEKGL